MESKKNWKILRLDLVHFLIFSQVTMGVIRSGSRGETVNRAQSGRLWGFKRQLQSTAICPQHHQPSSRMGAGEEHMVGRCGRKWADSGRAGGLGRGLLRPQTSWSWSAELGPALPSPLFHQVPPAGGRGGAGVGGANPGGAKGGGGGDSRGEGAGGEAARSARHSASLLRGSALTSCPGATAGPPTPAPARPLQPDLTLQAPSPGSALRPEGAPCERPVPAPRRPLPQPRREGNGARGAMRGQGRKESLSDSRDLDGSYDQLTGESGARAEGG